MDTFFFFLHYRFKGPLGGQDLFPHIAGRRKKKGGYKIESCMHMYIKSNLNYYVDFSLYYFLRCIFYSSC